MDTINAIQGLEILQTLFVAAFAVPCLIGLLFLGWR